MNKSQIKRRKQFRDEAKRILSNYDDIELKDVLDKERKASKYSEWKSDYHALLEVGRIWNDLEPAQFRVFVMAVYGWMPVLYSQKNIQMLKSNINKILEKERMSVEIIKESMTAFSSGKHTSGSISALSKLLHFCKPTKFPIWDNRVARSLGRNSGTGNSAEIYMDYFLKMSELNNDKQLSGYTKIYKKIVDSRATKLRSLEHGLFLYRP